MLRMTVIVTVINSWKEKIFLDQGFGRGWVKKLKKKELAQLILKGQKLN